MARLKNWFVIINPTSGNGSSARKWPIIKKILEAHAFEFSYAFTEYANHSTIIVQNAVEEGFRNIISIGGDGTLHNIVNGVMKQSFAPSASINIGVIPIGTGNDWVKTHHISKDIKKAIQIIKNGKIKKQDVGKIILNDDIENPIYFINLAGIGFDGYVVSKVEKYKRIGTLAYLLEALFGIASYKNFNSKTLINSEEVSGKTLMILIGLCTYSGGGMRLTKTPDPFDALLDVSVAKNFNKFDVIKNILKLFNGNVVNFKKVDAFKSASVKIEVDQNEFPYIQADGELIGKGNMNVSLIPNSFSFYSG